MIGTEVKLYRGVTGYIARNPFNPINPNALNDQNLAKPVTVPSGCTVLILAENERGGYRAMSMSCYIKKSMWQWCGEHSGGEYIPHLPVGCIDGACSKQGTGHSILPEPLEHGHMGGICTECGCDYLFDDSKGVYIHP